MRLRGRNARPLSGSSRGLEVRIEMNLRCMRSLGRVHRSHVLGSEKRLLRPVLSEVLNKTLLWGNR